MPDPKWDKIWTIFHDALDRPAGDRARVVESLCGDDQPLQAEVERLLAAHDTPLPLLEDPTLRPRMAEGAPLDLQPGESVGPYTILGVIGEGGMGIVYDAEQRAPVRRRVALKLIRVGMDTREVVARFDIERQALALMSHPSIAGVYDAGATGSGRPYFVMERVDGQPLTDYCDAHRLPVAARLSLFIRVCEGVQHAHQKGIVHRDLKPSNILVEETAEGPVPKIIDFGIAKAIDQSEAARTLFTRLGAALGTPEYMSPEQAEPNRDDIDTRSDVYALGVLLYELLVGSRPFESEVARDGTWEELRRRIREDTPQRPSTRAGSLDRETASGAAARRRTEPRALCRELSGDLDWVVMKALEKDRSRRYGSPTEFAADVRRYLSHQPVEAGPPSAAYRASKFFRRHRMGTGLAAAALLAVLAFAVTMSIQTARAARERDRAESAEAQARRELRRANEVTEFLTGLFRVSNPEESLGRTITAREMLDKGAERVKSELGDDPLLQGRLLTTMSTAYQSLALYERGRELIDQAVHIYRERAPDDRAGLASALLGSGGQLYLTGDLRGAVAEYEEALAVLSTADSADRTVEAMVLEDLGVAFKDLQELDRSVDAHQRALAILESSPEPPRADVARVLTKLAASYDAMRRWDAAAEAFARAIPMLEEAHGADHPQVAYALNSLAILDWHQDRFDEARRLLERALPILDRAFGADHPYTASVRGNMGRLLHDMGDLEAAAPYYQASLAAHEKALGPEHPIVATDLANLARLLKDQGRAAEARPLYERAIRIREERLGPDHRFLIEPLEGFAETLRAAGEEAAAARAEARARALQESGQSPP